jgi:glycosyltransferase involved in cell wall biosynthesis
MRICFFSTGSDLQGGAERSQTIIAQHMLDEGHDVHVVLQRECELSAYYRGRGARVHVLYWQHLRKLSNPLHVLRYLLWLPIITVRLVRLLRRERIDLVHVNEILDFQGLAAARLAGVPSVVFVRIILPIQALRAPLAAIALALANRAVAVSGAVHRLALCGWRNRKIRIIYNGGPDYGQFDPAGKRPIRPPNADGNLVIGLVAKLVRSKGHLVLLELAERLRRRGLDNVRYVVVGGTVPGHEAFAAELRRQIDDRGLADLVHLAGKQRDVSGYLAGMDIVCHLPLCEDCFPAVPLETAAMRKPLLSFRSGGIPEQLTHPHSARLVAIGDVEELTRHAAELVEDPALRQRIGESARREIQAKFSRPKHLGEVDALYRELLAGR